MNNLFQNIPLFALASIFLILSIVGIIRIIYKSQSNYGSYLNYICILISILLISEFFNFYIASWGWGILSFMILREYFSLVELRMQDRLGILVSYFSIPFMIHFVHTDWYNMFIITVPVYIFLIIPFLISISGKDSKGAIYSIGTIDFGLFFFVYCLGHLVYISFYSTWICALLIISIAICDSVSFYIENIITSNIKKIIINYFASTPIIITLFIIFSSWTSIPSNHSIIIALIIPALVIIGNHTIQYFEADLGISKDKMKTGRGLLIDNVKSILYTAPIIFHYIKYFLK